MRDEIEKIEKEFDKSWDSDWFGHLVVDFTKDEKEKIKQFYRKHILSLFKRKLGELRNLPKYKPTSDYTLSNMEYIKVSDLNKAITKLEEECKK